MSQFRFQIAMCVINFRFISQTCHLAVSKRGEEKGCVHTCMFKPQHNIPQQRVFHPTHSFMLWDDWRPLFRAVRIFECMICIWHELVFHFVTKSSPKTNIYTFKCNFTHFTEENSNFMDIFFSLNILVLKQIFKSLNIKNSIFQK